MLNIRASQTAVEQTVSLHSMLNVLPFANIVLVLRAAVIITSAVLSANLLLMIQSSRPGAAAAPFVYSKMLLDVGLQDHFNAPQYTSIPKRKAGMQRPTHIQPEHSGQLFQAFEITMRPTHELAKTLVGIVPEIAQVDQSVALVRVFDRYTSLPCEDLIGNAWHQNMPV